MSTKPYHSVSPFRVYKNSAGFPVEAVKYGRSSEGENLMPVVYMRPHNASLSAEQFEAIAAAADAAIDAVLLQTPPTAG